MGLVLADPHPTDTLTGVDWSCFARRIVGGSAGLRGVHSSALGPGSSQFIDSPSEMPVRHLAKRICGWNLLEYGGTVFPRQVVPQVESFLLNWVIPVSSLTIQVFKFPNPKSLSFRKPCDLICLPSVWGKKMFPLALQWVQPLGCVWPSFQHSKLANSIPSKPIQLHDGASMISTNPPTGNYSQHLSLPKPPSETCCGCWYVRPIADF